MTKDFNKVDWALLKAKIQENVEGEFSPAYPLETLTECFKRLLLFPVSDSGLAGIPKRYTEALAKVLLERSDYVENVPIVANVEKPLRKLLSLVNPAEYASIKEDKEGLAAIISALRLNPNHINLSQPNLPTSQRANNGTHLHRVYQLRNSESHECQNWGDVKLLSLLQSALIIYLYAIGLHMPALKGILFGSNTYLSSVKEDFKKWQNRFVSLEGREILQEIALYAIETPKRGAEGESKPRQGEVAELRKELRKSGENQMILIGEAGIGKTTTMQYISYKDCENGDVPIYVELKLLTAQDRIIDIIKRKLADAAGDITTILNSSRTCVFLDGLNEVLPSIKDSVYREIIGLIRTYPKAFFMVSTRSQAYSGELGQIPIFALQKMDVARIHEFLKKNTDSSKVRELIQQAISDNQNWVRILGTPLILYMLIQVVSIEGDLPDDENKIILIFIRNVYHREKTKDYSFDEVWFHSLICHIAFESIDKVGDTNSGFSFVSIKKLLDGKIQIDDKKLFDALEKGVELSLLVKDGYLYRFSHQTYQETLAGDYINTIFAQ